MSDRRPRILSVDDNAAARYSRNRLLKGAGFEVTDAATGTAALAAVEACPDLVILDVGLPDIDGFEVCRRIKADPRTSTVPVLQVSASFVKGTDRTRALEGGADNFLVEPVEPEVLIATVNAMLRLRFAEDAVRRAAREWQATFEAINEGVALLDAESRVRRCNRAFCDFVGREPDALVGVSWRELMQELPVGEGRWDASTVGSGESRQSFQLRGRWIQAGQTPLADGGSAAGSVLVLTDVTDPVRALAKAEDANRLKDEFLAVLSHELRTPLNAIVGWSHLLQAGGLDEATTRRAMQTISRNAMVQNQLISDILDVSRIIAGKLRLELVPVDLVAVVEAAVDTVRPAALAKEIDLVLELARPATVVAGDSGRLQQVVWNLLANAIKFAPAGGRVRVRLSTKGADVEITIEDDGPGIAPEFLPYVFDRFRQADSSTTRPKGGLGLGLAIVRHLIELHGGSVSAANRKESRGAVFTVRLPGSRVEASAVEASAGGTSVSAVDTDFPSAVAGDARPLRGVRVLVVDDEEDARDLLIMVLTNAGADVLTAASTSEALPLIERELPDVLVSDIEMPGEDGYSLIRKTRALRHSRAADVPAVALTAYASSDDRMRARRAGFQVHVSKPVAPHELIAVMSTMAASRRR
jgi:PAS domain S-box-containing protein